MRIRPDLCGKFFRFSLPDFRYGCLVAGRTNTVNEIGAWLRGEVRTEVSPEEHSKWLSGRYFLDVAFLLDQLGWLKAAPAEEKKED